MCIRDRIWCFSQRSKNYLIKNGHKNIKLIPQIIDDSFWQFDNSPQGHILVIDPRNWGFYANRVHEAAEETTLPVRIITQMLSPEDLREEIYRSSVVIAKGRSAMEAIMCGRPTIVFGHDSGDGLVTLNTIGDMMITNMSGWSKSKDNKINLSDEIESATSLKKSHIIKLRKEMVNFVGIKYADVDMFLNG